MRSFKFMVDGKPLEADSASITGAQIKALAKADPNAGLFLEGRGNDPDQPISDSTVVDLSQPGREQFYTMPPATFGTGVR